MIQVNAGVWRKEGGSCPTRIVLRLNVLKGEYVVHDQYVTEDGAVNYSQGFYTNSKAAASVEFNRRENRNVGAKWVNCDLIDYVKSNKEKNNG